ncbi:MAG: FmdE, Molybdenum formylmethanofuran dehydrogenase operon [Syntrophorhabdus sp. PtaU1.Bin050]|nr:MAG: FmdE, Molybdenum formylmethanofuran dehydrogenase operon [Syntrophorhabdus sp. PtaU1.Bin050]
MGNILSYGFDEYISMVKSFHGSDAPGVLIGGFMVDLAYQHLPEGGLYEVICETAKCLPDAVQLLTPCTLGNQRIRVIDVGRFALTFYEKRTGVGVRVYIDCNKLDIWPDIKGWYLKLTPKNAQNHMVLLCQIRKAGTDICSVEKAQVDISTLKKKRSGLISICPSCGEAYRSTDGVICPACKGGVLPYVTTNRQKSALSDR